MSNKKAAKLHEHGVFVASDTDYKDNLDEAIEYYKEEQFKNTLIAAKLEKKLTTQNTPDTTPVNHTHVPDNTPVSPTPIKANIAHWAGPLNFARLFLLRIQREVNAVAEMNNAAAVTNAIKYTSKPLAVVAWAYYIPRLFYTVLSASVHRNEEGDSNVGNYLWKNKFNLSNDIAWFATGLTTCGITMNWWSIPLLGPHGIYLTVGLYAFDVINVASRCQSEIKALSRIARNERNLATKKKINAKISYLRAKRNMNTGIALGLLTGMAISVCPPIAVVGASVVVATCLISLFYKDRYLSKKEIHTSTNAAALLHHKLLVHVDKQIKRMQRKKNTKLSNSTKEKIEKYKEIKESLLTWKQTGTDTSYEQLNEIIVELKAYSGINRKKSSYLYSTPTTKTELNKLLAPFKRYAWKGSSQSLKKTFTSLNENNGPTANPQAA